MYCLKKEEMYKISQLFDGWNETLIWSCLQGYMGSAWISDIQKPQSAQIVVGDFCFFAGVPSSELVKNIPGDFSSPCILMIPENSAWERLIEKEYEGKCCRFMRYALKKEPSVFNRTKLSEYIEKLPEGYVLKKIDEQLYNTVKCEKWSRDLCSQFLTYEDYKKYGLGFVVLHDDEVVCGASSYTVYDKGIEIEIDTKEAYRRRGLAAACASKLILECLNKGLYPSWDAANRASAVLAEKLGYHFDKEYVTYEVSR